MSPSHLGHAVRTYSLTGDVREGFSEKAIIELRNREKLAMCDSHTKLELLEMAEIVSWVGVRG